MCRDSPAQCLLCATCRVSGYHVHAARGLFGGQVLEAQQLRLVYDAGGLAMHAGCKVIPTDDGLRTMLIVGLSGTGKTTTTFTRQNGSRPVQDDFIGLLQSAGFKVERDQMARGFIPVIYATKPVKA